jgi:nucleoid DNA-binding protein
VVGRSLSNISEVTGITKSETSTVVDAFISQIESSLQTGNDVSIVGFGTWKKKHRAARSGRNPQTGETLQIAAKNTVTFSAGKALKDSVN